MARIDPRSALETILLGGAVALGSTVILAIALILGMTLATLPA